MKVLYWLVSRHVLLIVLLLIVENICFISYKQTSDPSKLRFQMAQQINRETLGRALACFPARRFISEVAVTQSKREKI